MYFEEIFVSQFNFWPSRSTRYTNSYTQMKRKFSLFWKDQDMKEHFMSMCQAVIQANQNSSVNHVFVCKWSPTQHFRPRQNSKVFGKHELNNYILVSATFFFTACPVLWKKLVTPIHHMFYLTYGCCKLQNCINFFFFQKYTLTTSSFHAFTFIPFLCTVSNRWTPVSADKILMEKKNIPAGPRLLQIMSLVLLASVQNYMLNNPIQLYGANLVCEKTAK